MHIRKMFHDIIELHMKLQKNREEAEAARDPTKYKLRIASVAATERKKELERRIKERDAIQPLNLGCDYKEISSILRIPMSEIGRIEKEEKETRRFLATGQIARGDGGYFAIHHGLPTQQ
jgi:hypothetical protein